MHILKKKLFTYVSFWAYLKQPILVTLIEGQTTTTTDICVDSGFSFDEGSEVDNLIFTTTKTQKKWKTNDFSWTLQRTTKSKSEGTDEYRESQWRSA